MHLPYTLRTPSVHPPYTAHYRPYTLRTPSIRGSLRLYSLRTPFGTPVAAALRTPFGTTDSVHHSVRFD